MTLIGQHEYGSGADKDDEISRLRSERDSTFKEFKLALEANARLRAELAEAKNSISVLCGEDIANAERANRAEEEIARLREAVTFYATALPLAYQEDAGYTARAALAPRPPEGKGE
jgi:chromosome segregation ATPase